MKFHVLTLMPEMIQQGLNWGVVGKGLQKNLFEVEVINPRQFTHDVHQTVDDRPFGGSDGMLMMAEPLDQAIQASSPCQRKILLSPQGRKFDHQMALELSQASSVMLICARYGGVDQRLIHSQNLEEVSVGDYVLSGGELGALVMIDSVARLIPGVLGHASSSHQDSFANGLLEAPFFTRPREWNGLSVPSLLLSGDHQKTQAYQDALSLVVTLLKRPDLLNEVEVNWAKDVLPWLQKMEISDWKSLGWNKESVFSLIDLQIKGSRRV